MEILQPTLFERILSWCLSLFVSKRRHPLLSIEELTSLYNTEMFCQRGNFFHRHIVFRWAEQIRVDETQLEAIRLAATQGPLVYITFNLGQLEYNVLNNILLEQKLPLAIFNNVLRVRRWLSFQEYLENLRARIRSLTRTKTLPDPFTTGYLQKLLEGGKSLLLSFDEWDPEYLSSANKKFLEHLFEIQKQLAKPITLVPSLLIWDKRPQKEKASIFEALFGENERPSRWRKIILFFRHYKKRAVQKFGEPIILPTFAGSPVQLYQKILNSFQMERRTLTGPMIHPRQWFLDKILEDEALNKLIYEVAKEKQKPIDSVKKLVLNYSKEIAADLRYNYIEFAAAILAWFFRHFFEGINCDREGIQRLKKTLKQGPTILVPNHRSHIDYLLLGYLCYHYDIVSPYVAAGINMAFWPMGTFFRRCGAFFLRRSFEGNILYKKVFQTYLKILIQEGYPQEFFIEGGRSRTGKLRSPKLGMLSMYSDAIAEGAAKDIYFMPVSITYDRVLEEKSYLEEMEGKPKRKEKITDLLKLRKFLKGRYGKIYLRFDEPISWQEMARQVGETEWDKKRGRMVPSSLVPALADRICHAINRQVVATPKALVASALLQTPRLGVKIPEVQKSFDQLLHYLKWKKAPLSDTLVKNPKGACYEALAQIEAAGLIKRHVGLEQGFFEVPAGERPELNLIKNFSIHRFISISLWSTLLLAHSEKTLTLEKLANEYALLQDLFQNEFRFSTRRPLLEHLDTLCCYLQEQKAIHYHQGEIAKEPEGEVLLKEWSDLIKNYLESYWITWETLLLRPSEPLATKAMLKEIRRHAQDQCLLGKLKYPEAISQVVFENALQTFARFSAQDRILKKSLERLLGI